MTTMMKLERETCTRCGGSGHYSAEAVEAAFLDVDRLWVVVVMPIPGVTPTNEPGVMGPWTREKAEARAAEIRAVCRNQIFVVQALPY